MKLPPDEESRARKRLGAILTAMKAIQAAAGDRAFTKSQDADFAELSREAVELRERLGEPVQIDREDLAAVSKKMIVDEAEAWASKIRRPIEPDKLGGPSDGGLGLRKSDGSVRVLTKGQGLAGLVGPGQPGLTTGGFLKAIVTGDWSGVPHEAKAQAVGSDIGGGYLVPSPLAARVIDKARNAARVVQAGAITVPMETNTLTIARVSGDPTAGWKQENAAAVASDMSFEAVTFRSKTLIALVKSSVELFEDAQELESTVENALAESFALELDRAALRGAGAAAEPLGLLNQAGVTIVSSVGSPTDYVKFADDPTKTLREANAAEPYAFISAPRTFHSLAKLVTGIAGDKTRLKPPAEWDAMNRYPTNQIPTNLGAGTNESQAFIGDFSQLMIGTRTTFTLEASRQAADSSGSAFGNLQIWIRAYLRADIALVHPNHFVVLDGILA